MMEENFELKSQREELDIKELLEDILDIPLEDLFMIEEVDILLAGDMMERDQEKGKDQERDIIEIEVQDILLEDHHHQEIENQEREIFEEEEDMMIEDIVIMEEEEERDLILDLEKDMMIIIDTEIDLENEDNI